MATTLNSESIAREGFMKYYDTGTKSWKNLYFKLNEGSLESYDNNKNTGNLLWKINLQGCKVTLEINCR